MNQPSKSTKGTQGKEIIQTTDDRDETLLVGWDRKSDHVRQMMIIITTIARRKFVRQGYDTRGGIAIGWLNAMMMPVVDSWMSPRKRMEKNGMSYAPRRPRFEKEETLALFVHDHLDLDLDLDRLAIN